MKRIPLHSGTQIKSDSLCFVIDSVIGKGANCIVYGAHYDDGFKHKKEIVIKECYPIRANITRQQNTLLWSSVDEMKSAFDILQSSYDLASEMQNSNLTRSASVYALDKIYANGTQYIIMIPQHGYSYDKEKNTDISDIIRTALALCNAVGFYHKSGFLHLDIKPSNFIATTDHTGKGKNIALFDLDTLVAMDDLQKNSIIGVSYTKEWAAPEQKQMQINKLCPATDLFAIGSIMFERLMNRMPTNTDMSLFAEWEFDDRFNAKKVNPKAKRLLTEIFHKTLAANVKRRYQSTDELVKVLDELLSVVTSGKPYLITNCPVNSIDVLGRYNDIDTISKEFLSGKSTVFLHGVAGIGKSTLAIAYGNKYQNNYDAVLFMRYNDSLEALLDEIDIYNCDATGTEGRKKILRELLDQNVLLIIDNFDVSIEQDEYLFDLLKFRTNIIFTTRTNFEDILNGDITQIEVNPLVKEELIKLFTHFSNVEITSENEQVIEKMFYQVGFNTYAVELLARQIAVSDWSIDILAKKISDGLYGLDGSERVISNKDGKIIKKNIPDVIHILFDLANLNEGQKQVLRNLYVLRFLNIDKKTYLDIYWTPPHNMDVVNDLVEVGWVQKNNKFYYLHPLVEELVSNELSPCEENCQKVFVSMRDRMNRCSESDGINHQAERRAFEMNCMISIRFLTGLNMNIESNYYLASKWLIELIENPDVDLPDMSTITPLLNRLNRFSRLYNTDFENKYINFSFLLYEFSIYYLRDSEQRSKKRLEELYRSFSEAKDSIALLKQEQQQEAIKRLYSIIDTFHNGYLFALPDEFIIQRYNEHPELFECNPIERRKEMHSSWEEKNCQPIEEDVETKTINEYQKSNDRIAYIQGIADNDCIPLYERMERIGYCTDSFFDLPSWIKLKTHNEWIMISEILPIEEVILDKCLDTNMSDYEKDDCYYRLKQNYCNQCTAKAALNESSEFKKYAELLFELADQEMDFYFSNSNQPTDMQFTNVSYILLSVDSLIEYLQYIDKSSWGLPYWIKFGEECTIKFQDSTFENEDILVDIYESIIMCAKNALCESGINEIQKKEYKKIAKEYEERCNKISDVDFSLKSDDE